MPHLDEFEPGSDREHCRLDLHKVQDGTMGADAWVKRWGVKVETFLRDGLTEDEAADMEDDGETEDLRSALEDLREAGRKTIAALDKIVVGEDHADTTAQIDEAAGILENAL